MRMCAQPQILETMTCKGLLFVRDFLNLLTKTSNKTHVYEEGILFICLINHINGIIRLCVKPNGEFYSRKSNILLFYPCGHNLLLLTTEF